MNRLRRATFTGRKLRKVQQVLDLLQKPQIIQFSVGGFHATPVAIVF